MRELTDPERLHTFMSELGRRVRGRLNVYLVGGGTAVLHGWRVTTVDIDLALDPDSDEALRAIAMLKDELRVNVELAAPDQFIPALPGWQERSIFIERHGAVSFFHYDLYSQALAKIERSHALDREDVLRMLQDGLVDRRRLWELFERIEPQLHRFPAIDPPTFRRAVDQVVRIMDDEG